MEAHEPLLDLGIALMAGLLVGLERQQSHEPAEGSGSFLGGVRTFPLFALLGALSVIVGRAVSFWVVAVALAGLVTLVALAFADDAQKGRDRGMTSEIGALVTFLLGCLAAAREAVPATQERVILVASTAVVVTLLLSSKPQLHGLVKRVSSDDVYATVKFLIVSIVVLPLLPNRTFGPLAVLNPFNVGLMVVLIAGISFVGYVAGRVLGSGRGLAVTALLGGLVSSTAVTLSFAARAKKAPELAPMAAVAIVLASTIMFGRVLVEVGVVHAPLLADVAWPISAMGLGGLAAAAALFLRARNGDRSGSDVELQNPFELGSAVRMALLFAGVLLVSKAAQVYAGAGGLYAAAALAGTTDVDAITLSTANLAKGGLDPRVASTVVVIGAATNTVVKASLAMALGGKRLGKLVAMACASMLVAGGAVLAFRWT